MKIKQQKFFMDKLFSKQDNYQSKLRQWIAIFAALLSLISGSVLLYQWWQVKQNAVKIQEKEQILTQLEQKEQVKAQQEYQEQQKQLPKVLDLAKNPAIHNFFNDLLCGYAYRALQKSKI